MVTDFKTLKKAAKNPDTSLPKIKIAILGDTATQLLNTAIRGAAAVNGFCAEVFEAEFNQVEQQVFDPTSDYHKFGAEITVIFQSSHNHHLQLPRNRRFCLWTVRQQDRKLGNLSV